MKKTILVALLGIFTLSSVLAPATTFAKDDDDDDRYESRYDDDWDEDEDDDDWDDDRYEDDDSNDDELEVEADVFTDTTIVKVELRNGKKSYFSTSADTRAEVIDEVADRFNLSESEVDAALEFEFEDRASRPKDRGNITIIKDRDDAVCTDASSTLEIEADIFTDTTIVKVELRNGNKSVFETDVTSTDDIVDEVAKRYTSLTKDEIKNALDREIEDRASRLNDFRISSNDRDCDDDSNNDEDDSNDKDVRNRLKELQELLRTLIRLLTERTS